MRYFKKVVGESCYLSPINSKDAPRYTEWLNDLNLSRFFTLSQQVISLEKEEEILKQMIARGDKMFAIIDLFSETLIGNCSLFNIDHIHQTAELGIFIGNRTHWNRGFGCEATKLLLDYGFNILNLHNIMLSVFDFNKRAIKSYLNAGFKEIGRRREAIFIGGEKHDFVYLDILASEYESVYINKIVKQDNDQKN